MKKVAILAADKCVLSSIASPMDMFLQAGVLWNVTMGEAPAPMFEVKIVTADGNPVTAINDVPVIPNCSMHDIEFPDLVIVPSQGFFFDPRSASHANRTEWLKSAFENGSDLASVCAGAFTLASTGLLDGKKATTHWGMAKQFQKSFPNVDLRTDLLVTDEERLFCGGGISAELNLSLYLIEKYCGREIALQSARCTLVDLDRITQSPFAMFTPEKNHSDSVIKDVQNRIECTFEAHVDVDALAAEAGMSVRQFNRRFKSATGETVTGYLQLIRIEAAKTKLVNTRLPFEEISARVGYENTSFFRRIFKKCTSITPTEYRRRFGNR
ncbi:HTH-type transcriptional regulator CdhR [Pseudovibrio axinellae]|uniref:HTH-type transcriptional regulator CdhR n=1 Tax=Pseudovibrio axinellae TaxID=989403 RepID=A0A165ZFB6_9HYPH|nr:helix-turn-helix domain-containing protein [Pseudovibrio axinellae]KZL19831.1 HTH-type transcriptional regulator CdhR [Pseudovibrio axinellae]SER39777.1 transcriptional regulator, AraC family with amidase-like domain [Pseudovibrio axinellae]